jgi:hypothetical protein
MAIVSNAFSPKEFQVWIETETTAGDTAIHASNMHQLDVDSVSMPSLNVNQVLDVRSGAGRTLKIEDFFQDNKLRILELSLSGTLHKDVGHELLLRNICADATTSGDVSIASGFVGATEIYGSSLTTAQSTLTVVIKSSEHSNQRSLELPGMLVTNLAISADTGTEGGRYKFSATLQSGRVPDLNESTVLAGSNAYANTTDKFLSTASASHIFGTDVILQNFTTTIDSPAVFTGFKTTGYQGIARGTETAVTVDATAKYDGNTKGFIHSFDTQTAAFSGDHTADPATYMFKIVNDNAFGMEIRNGVFTNVAYNEGDIMMLDCSIKSVDDGTDDLITFDLA